MYTKRTHLAYFGSHIRTLLRSLHFPVQHFQCPPRPNLFSENLPSCIEQTVPHCPSRWNAKLRCSLVVQVGRRISSWCRPQWRTTADTVNRHAELMYM